MIAANELRLGNWVNITQGSGFIVNINSVAENIILEYDNYIDGNRTYIQKPLFDSNLEIKRIIIESGEYAVIELEFSTKAKDGFILIYDIEHSSDMSDFTRAHDIIKEGSVLRFILEETETKYFSFNGNFDLVDRFSPIPLTEGILLNCGFEKINKNGELYFLKGDCFELHQFNQYGHFSYTCGDNLKGNFVSTRIDSLHHLQNLYFALTGKELEVKI